MEGAKEKSHNPNLAVKESDHNKNYFETIIAPWEDIDNNEVFDMETGETVRDL